MFNLYMFWRKCLRFVGVESMVHLGCGGIVWAAVRSSAVCLGRLGCCWIDGSTYGSIMIRLDRWGVYTGQLAVVGLMTMIGCGGIDWDAAGSSGMCLDCLQCAWIARGASGSIGVLLDRRGHKWVDWNAMGSSGVHLDRPQCD
ncbi:hypothetical protein BJ138DRAFT_219358 [Hygrophoropsis aurantiaca]|uniref:Uncharacterized protein n=1 Tax=Hygrophoropsis aurantiaca TaxID=72124 RepID=A0ACB7ZQT0_9AGAM|nr:hypothetical protein BJ138DRAFT_219358 [Hygrophoropsis aurantiaca]